MHSQARTLSTNGTDATTRPHPHTARYLRAPFLLIALLSFLLLTIGCGEKKRTTRNVPPPPPIGSGDKTATAKPSPPTPRTEKKTDTDDGVVANSDDEFAEYENNKPIWTEVGYASWYGPPYHNRRGANGEIYNQNAMTAAHRSLPMNSIVRVTNLKTGQKQIVRITDRGPFVGDRIIDLSAAAAKAVDVWRPGTAKVKLEVLFAPSDIETGGRWCVQVGAFSNQEEAIKLKERLMKRYHTAKVLQFPGPTGFWVRVRVLDDDKSRAQEVAKVINVDEGGVFLVRLD
jgi:rare lipoprotein A